MNFKFWNKRGKPKVKIGSDEEGLKSQRKSALLSRKMVFDIEDDKRFTIDSSEFSRHDFEMLRLRAPELEKLKKKGEKHLQHFHELQHDFYQMLYKGQPRIREASELYRDFVLHRQLVQWMEPMEELKQLHSSTTRNKLASVVATKKLNDIIEQLPKSAKKAVNDAQQKSDDLRGAMRRLNAFRRLWQQAKDAGDQDMMDKLKEMGEELSQIVQESKEVADAAVNKAQEKLKEHEDAIKDQMRDNLQGAASDCKDTNDSLSAMGCGKGRGHSRQVNEEKMIELATQIQEQPDLKKIAKIAGRMQHILDEAKRNRVKHTGGEIVDTELAGDISRMTGSEISRMAHPLLKKELFARLYDHRVSCWTKESPETLGKGPMICAVDSSGSMSGAPIYWAKAVACMMYREAKNRNQPFTMMHYSSSDHGWSSEDDNDEGWKQKAIDSNDGIWKRTFKSSADDADFLDFATFFESGGTDYGLAFAGIQSCFKESKKMQKADVIFISDECFPVEDIMPQVEAFRKTIDGVHGKVLGVSVADGWDNEGAVTAFNHFCDAAWHLDIANLKDEAPVIEQMFIDNFGVI